MSRHVTAKVIAEEFGLSARHWTRMASAGKIPGAWQPSGEGGHWLFDLDAFRRWRTSTQKKVAEWPGYTRGVRSGGRVRIATERNTAFPLEREIDGWLKSALENG
ncbi:helix-turn-helix domain-containing protein [Antarcticirhabdus aurantiaca]|uniref:Helix-turn-helix domain-containing protein n=1 Tax=Antarcticirhabdus aurantiaca TaxID=2606717 RepID=A0ACD4NJW4_9HYPH|nr:helix-turn-helix domain-containing protein [Antarcticirhabdus aurantiaca]WAJ27160.1 helix-turn-helix domain-containing protein [Jeongeuplla avenae]